jgi:hypothetical protein
MVKFACVQHEMGALEAHAFALQADKLRASMQPVGRTEAQRRTRTSYPGCLGGIEIASRVRPFARRRLSTLRPPGVAIRARKPWVRFRRRL